MLPRFARPLLVAIILPILVAAPPGADAQDRRVAPEAIASYRYGYHSYAESTALLNDLATRYPRLATLSSLGKSATGLRDVWCTTLTNSATGAPDTKPAVYHDGNQHAAEVMGGEVTLHLVHYLLTRYGTDPDVTRFLDTRVIYVVQRADPDGAEAFMRARWTGRLKRCLAREMRTPMAARAKMARRTSTGTARSCACATPTPRASGNRTAAIRA